jgi:hypothetical protein
VKAEATVRERELLKAALTTSEACATIEELSGLSDASLAEPVRARISEHVTGCPRCQAELALLEKFESAVAGADEEGAASWITARLESRFEQITGAAPASSQERTERKPWWRRLFGFRLLGSTPATAAAFALGLAMLFIVLNLPIGTSREPALSPDVAFRPPVFRSDALAVVGPTGDLEEAPTEMRWQPAPGAATYSVQLMEVDRVELWKGESSNPSLSLPPAVRTRIVPGKPLLWMVEARDASGRTIATSEIQRFRVAMAAPRSTK